MKRFYHSLSLGFLLPILSGVATSEDSKPNILLVFCDDLGYGDIGANGNTQVDTPNIDRLAREGLRFTNFCVAESVCTASRVGLLTGCYPVRVGLGGAIGPKNPKGIHADEILMPEILREQGYATKAIGKWHLGDQPEFLPTRHGFDEYYGIPYSNDMWPNHPRAGDRFPPLPMLENETVIDPQLEWEDQNLLTTRFTSEALEFIERDQKKPWFLYLAHSMPHVPIGASPKFAGRHPDYPFLDVIEEIDDSLGKLLASLDRSGDSENTWVIFTSDNGPWISYGTHSGVAKPYRDGKHTLFEGGFRVPCLMRYPREIPAGVVTDELFSTMDLLPTLAALVGQELPADRVIDGHNIIDELKKPSEATSPWEEFHYFKNERRAIRAGKWKLMLPHNTHFTLNFGTDGIPGETENRDLPLTLFNLETDLSETTNVAAEHSDLVEELKSRVAAFDKALAANSRPAGEVEKPVLLNAAFINGDTVMLDNPLHEVPGDIARKDGGIWTNRGVWTKGEGWTTGLDVPAENHGPSLIAKLKMEDVRFEYQVRFRDADRHTFAFHDFENPGHFFHIDFMKDKMQVVKNRHNGKRADPTQGKLASRAINLENDKWYTIRVSVLDGTLRTEIGEFGLKVAHPEFHDPTGGFNFYLARGSLDFRNLTIHRLGKEQQQSEADSH